MKGNDLETLHLKIDRLEKLIYELIRSQQCNQLNKINYGDGKQTGIEYWNHRVTSMVKASEMNRDLVALGVDKEYIEKISSKALRDTLEQFKESDRGWHNKYFPNNHTKEGE